MDPRRLTSHRIPFAAAALACVLPVCAHAWFEPPTPVAEAGTWAWQYQPDEFRPDAVLDLRFLNEKEAGETGFVRLSADGNSFIRGDGKPIRFFAVGSDIYRKPAELARHARFLAKRGVNMVRLHASISPKKPGSSVTDVDQEEIDHIWRAVAAFKKEGIYLTISPFWANAGHSGAQASWGLDGYGDKQDIWGLIFFNPKLQDAYRHWARALYEPKNPYTGISLAQDPAVAVIQVQNEDSLLFWTAQAIKPPQMAILSEAFGTWSARKYGTLEKAKAAWGGAAATGDDLAAGKLGILPTWQLIAGNTGNLEARVRDQVQFMAETQRKFYGDMTAFYKKELGCKSLVNACNWITADPIKLNDIERWTYTATDVLAVNKYTGGTHTGSNNGWRIDPGHHFTAASNLKDWRALPTNLKQVEGHPMLVTESTWVAPEPYQAEGPLLMSAYQSLTGVDGYYWFSETAPEYEPEPYFTFANLNGGQHPLHKWTASTPALTGNFPAAAILYRLGYVKEAAPVVREVRKTADLWARQSPAIAEDRSFDPNRAGTAKGASDVARGIDPAAFLVGPVTEWFDAPGQTTAADLTPYVDRAAQTVTSATGELRLNYGKGVCTINAPKAQAAVGFLSEAGKITLGDVTIESKNRYASVGVVALDDLPLKLSKKILVQVGTEVRPTGWETKETEFKSEDGKKTYQGYEVVNTGKMPWRVQNTDVTLTVANPKLTRATVLDSAGYSVNQLPLGPATGGKVVVKLPPDAMYVVLR